MTTVVFFVAVRALRCASHREMIALWERLLHYQLKNGKMPEPTRRVAILTCGAPAPGMSACVATLVINDEFVF